MHAAAQAELAPRTALLAGASGLVGRALLDLLLADPGWSAVHALVRRPLTGGPQHAKLHTLTVDFAHLSRLPAVDDCFIALGTTIKQAGSEAAFRAVDFDAVLATARAARRAGAQRLFLVSALGADAHSRVFYNRVKGEVETAVQSLGFATVVVARPSLLLGDRAALGQPTRWAEGLSQTLLRPLSRLLPRAVRPVAAGAVAQALVQAAHEQHSGVHVLHSADMQQA
ncbi:NAD(P)H-binding protein [Inhella gelatinilytica]|uniref:NAD(P)H-binding protein n=1 Tax=Inhella gelatinilytica TaxID=2795030 RepID=A0A931NAC4_9BURK|nr:NAD(P)H-binding protein [Inhella gelatinilytica]MBH9552318.1 NAD(P)H-binding protein [Inhella gelatinilytica]